MKIFKNRSKFTALRHLQRILIVGSLLLVSCFPTHAQEPRDWAKEHLEEFIALYRHFHSHPELSFAEKETAARVANELQKSGWDVATGVGGYGVVALLKNGAGPTVMVRTDLDALPVVEQTGLVYASQVKAKGPDGNEVGVMHACGHDIHITNLIAVARYLASHKDRWTGTVMLIGQPAEERVAGANAMLKDGLFERFPKPDFGLALHVDSSLPTGTVAVSGGYTMANSDSVDVTILGRGGHGAAPHTTVDPIVTAAQFIVSLQTIVSREVKPTEPAVITVGAIHGGSKHNIIGDACHLQLTVRSYSDSVRKQLHAAIERKAKAAAMSAGAPEPIIKVNEGTSALLNNEDLAARVRKTFIELLGEEHVVDAEKSMGAEDFSEYGKAGVPVVMYRLGSVDQKRLARFKELGQTPPSLHSPLYYPDVDEALVTGISSMSAAVLDLLKP
jgi:hippurate hydrolase